MTTMFGRRGASAAEAMAGAMSAATMPMAPSILDNQLRLPGFLAMASNPCCKMASTACLLNGWLMKIPQNWAPSRLPWIESTFRAACPCCGVEPSHLAWAWMPGASAAAATLFTDLCEIWSNCGDRMQREVSFQRGTGTVYRNSAKHEN
jgi:hypothetical protein